MEKDFYEILGIPRDADADTIKKAYRRLALQFHPDRNPGDKAAEEKFKECAHAYEVLSDQDKRMRYDRFGHAGLGGFGSGAGHGFADASDIFEAFGDIFGDIFGGPQRGGRGGAARSHKGSDLRYILEIDLLEVLTGSKRDIEFTTEGMCGTCEGNGAEPGTSPEVCSACEGTGQIVRSQGFFSMATTCGTCRGRGQVIRKPCKRCKGKGREPLARQLTVNVPPGVDNGTKLRLTGEGEGGFLSGPAGDLYVEIRVRPDARFEREEDHLIGKLKISYLQALLGAEISFQTLNSTETIQVSKGTAPGSLFRVSGLGTPNLRSGRRGDLILQVEVEIPSRLTKEEERLLREIADSKEEKVAGPARGIFSRR